MELRLQQPQKFRGTQRSCRLSVIILSHHFILPLCVFVCNPKIPIARLVPISRFKWEKDNFNSLFSESPTEDALFKYIVQ